jgi:spore maturation protein CgeB
MPDSKNIAFFASSLLSAYWNGAATYYRGIIRALHDRGHQVTFYEPDIFDRSAHRDIEEPDWARVVVYPLQSEADADAALAMASQADVVVKASGVGAFDDYLESAVLRHKHRGATVIFWDVDAPATLDRIESDPSDPFHASIPHYDYILTYGGGDKVVESYLAHGAQACIPIYNALDPDTHHPVPPDPTFPADLSFLGNRLPDREARVEHFFLDVAARCPDKTFLLGGSGWADKPMPANVNYVGHVFTAQHNAFNCTPTAVLNISRDSMASYGFSPATRVFEAAGAGACIITDYWIGIDAFLEPGKEILVARTADDVARHLKDLTPVRAREIGQAAMKRVLAQHTYAHRAALVEEIMQNGAPLAGASRVGAL